MYFDNKLTSENRSPAIRVASLYREAISLRELENQGFSSPSSCEYNSLSDYPATASGFDCLSEQFASHMFKPGLMYDSLNVRTVLDFLWRKAQEDKSNAGIISAFTVNDSSTRQNAANRAIALLKAEPRTLGRLMGGLRSNALPYLLDEVKKYLLDGDGYFLFDSVNKEMAKISEESKKKSERATNPQKKFKHKQEGVAKKIRVLRGIVSLSGDVSDVDKVLNSFFVKHGKMLGQILKLTDRNIVKADRNLAQGVSSSRVKSIMQSDKTDYSEMVGEAIRNSESLGRAYRSAIFDNFRPGEGITRSSLQGIAEDLLPAFRASARFVGWIDRVLKSKNGSRVLARSIVKFLMGENVLEMTEIDLQNMMDDANRTASEKIISDLEVRIARLENKKAYTPKHPKDDPRNAELINHILTNGIVKFTPRGNLSGRAGVYYYPIGFGMKNPPVSLYLSGSKIAIMEWNGRKWTKYIDQNLKEVRENPALLNRWFKLMNRMLES
jgi:hypothetical protein